MFLVLGGYKIKHVIYCSGMSAEIDEHGAELGSLKCRGTEYIWQGNTASWNSHSPFLFPYIGRMNNDHFKVGQVKYKTGIHGFAKDMTWTAAAVGEDFIELCACSHSGTMQLYPYEFMLKSKFHIKEDGISIQRTVLNTGRETMPFSIGEHPGFCVPLQEDGEFDNCSLVFSQRETASRYEHTAPLVGDRVPFLDGCDTIPLRRRLFKEMRVILLHRLSSDYVTLMVRGRSKVSMKIKGFSYLGLWTHPNPSAFICIEPWNGLPSREDSPGELIKKEGFRLLDPETDYSYSYEIKVTGWGE